MFCPWFPCANVFLWIHTWKLTWHWKITICNRKYIFKWWIFHCHVSFRGGYHHGAFVKLKVCFLLSSVNRWLLFCRDNLAFSGSAGGRMISSPHQVGGKCVGFFRKNSERSQHAVQCKEGGWCTGIQDWYSWYSPVYNIFIYTRYNYRIFRSI